MLVAGWKKAEDFMKPRTQAQDVLLSWLQLVEDATWATPHELWLTFQAADRLPDTDLWVFDVRGNKYRVVARVDFAGQQVQIRYVFTHDQYLQWLHNRR